MPHLEGRAAAAGSPAPFTNGVEPISGRRELEPYRALAPPWSTDDVRARDDIPTDRREQRVATLRPDVSMQRDPGACAEIPGAGQCGSAHVGGGMLLPGPLRGDRATPAPSGATRASASDVSVGRCASASTSARSYRTRPPGPRSLGPARPVRRT